MCNESFIFIGMLIAFVCFTAGFAIGYNDCNQRNGRG